MSHLLCVGLLYDARLPAGGYDGNRTGPGWGPFLRPPYLGTASGPPGCTTDVSTPTD